MGPGYRRITPVQKDPTGQFILSKHAGQSSYAELCFVGSKTPSWLDAKGVRRILSGLSRAVHVNPRFREDVLSDALLPATIHALRTLAPGRLVVIDEPTSEERVRAIATIIAKRNASVAAKQADLFVPLSQTMPDNRAARDFDQVENRLVIAQIRRGLIDAGHEALRVDAFLLRLARLLPGEIIEVLGMNPGSESIQQLHNWRRRQQALLTDLSKLTGCFHRRTKP